VDLDRALIGLICMRDCFRIFFAVKLSMDNFTAQNLICFILGFLTGWFFCILCLPKGRPPEAKPTAGD
jgi:hypothetical protein